MQPLSLADELTLTADGAGISLACDQAGLPTGERNLVWRAARKFAEETGIKVGVQIYLKKRIPVAAGLGGGSSDAAGTLLALNSLAGEPLNSRDLHRLAGQLGADVPFFLNLSPAVGRGIGTELTPFSLPPYWYVLLNPGVRISTRWVYENLDLASLKPPTPVAPEVWDVENPGGWVANDLETVTVKRYPQLQEILQTLRQLGARAQGMSGSGPTVFGLFSTTEAAQEAARKLRRTFPGWLAVARGLTGAVPERGWENQVWMI
jgi:4-diphosphocytidyl-2-C-methyl-D-erythritol kinase